MRETVSKDPELYARMAEPYPAAEDADAALEAFLADVAQLREQHRIQHVLVVAVANAAGLGGRPTAACQSCALGSEACHAEMAAAAFAMYAGPVIARADRLRKMAGERPNDDE